MVAVDRTGLDRTNGDAPPADVVDRLLWRDAQQMLGRHCGPGPDDQKCVWCGWRWPCAPRRLAERAAAAARRPWREAWTLRHDLNSIRSTPGLREADNDRGHRPIAPGGRRHASANRGSFDR
ncbi:hypothetical protein [Mangrovihabitans endophyticus]|uniref:Uncharacterized protein n=1 Tax=Mangrovihabitans endophyticus TaxID=1751298 RepID=A0A8J3C4F1_9ACTN|nr:hypothetical protein [Mangrovihabitans endophyticus]GGL07108.1 hypothetical protein GCM10012284_46650 [Mangrovihabitans endophyticus]